MFTALFKKQLEDVPEHQADPAPVVVWLHGRNGHAGWAKLGWQVMGVYTTESQAVACCKDEFDWIGPVTLNQPMSWDNEWPGVWFPAVQARPGEYVEP